MSSSTTVYKSAAYDNPSYTSRQSLEFGPITAGSAGQTVSKFVAHANLQAYSLCTYTTVAGTSTYTYTAGGTGTVAVAATQLSLIVVTNTASSGSTVALATTTYGPYTVGGNFFAGGTQTNQIGQYSEFQLNTNTGTAGLGGVVIPQGSQMYIVNGTDATAVEDIAVTYQIQPLASIAA
jgi:hypothetical protein